MLNKALTSGNAAAKITAATLARSDSNSKYDLITYTTQDPHNYFVGSMVTVVDSPGTNNTYSPLICYPIFKIDSPTKFSVKIGTTYSAVNSITFTIGTNALSFASNGHMNAVEVLYAQPSYMDV